MAGKTHIERALLEQYVLGLTTEEEGRQIEQYLAQHPAIAKEVRESQEMMEDFAIEYAIEPPNKLRRNVLSAVKETSKNSAKISPKLNSNWITGIAAIFALGFGLMTFLLYQQQSNLQNQIGSLENKVQQLENKNTRLVGQKAKINQQFTLLKDVNTSHVQLLGSNLSPKALIVVYWNEADKNAYLNIVDLPEIAANKSLQLWADVAGKMVNMGVLETNKKELLKVPYIPNVEALNITLEPKGGSTTPNVSQLYANGKML
ncbi:MAG: anti-sigma factor [Saprospiraceae bacterium]